jgi:hypothetical protein
MYLTDLGTIVYADLRSFVWAFSGPWPEVVEQLLRHIGSAVHAEMRKPAVESPKAVLILAPTVTQVAPDRKSYSVESEIIRDPKPSELSHPGGFLFQLDKDVAKLNVSVSRQLAYLRDCLSATKPLLQPGPIALS